MYHLLFFAFLSVCDLTLTWWLLTCHGDWVYESNPVANWFLTIFGWTGITVFKLVMVAVVLVCACRISRRRPRLAKRVLTGGCLVLAGVVFYSCCLAKSVSDWTADLATEQQRERRLAQQSSGLQGYRDLKERLTADLIWGRSSLKQAVAKLEMSDRVRSNKWAKALRAAHPDVSLARMLASALLDNVQTKLQGAASQEEVMNRLRKEYRADYGVHPSVPFMFTAATAKGL